MQKFIHSCINMQASAQECRRAWGWIVRKYPAEKWECCPVGANCGGRYGPGWWIVERAAASLAALCPAVWRSLTFRAIRCGKAGRRCPCWRNCLHWLPLALCRRIVGECVKHGGSVSRLNRWRRLLAGCNRWRMVCTLVAILPG